MSKPVRMFSLEPLESRALLASISGTEFSDLNANGTRDPGEPALPGFSVYLDLNRNHSLDDGEPSALTDSLGHYTIGDVPPGNYYVTQIAPPGWEQTNPAPSPPAPATALINLNHSSDAIRGAVSRLSDLNGYTSAQLRTATSWIVGLLPGKSIATVARALGATSAEPSKLIADTYLLSFARARTGGVAAQLAKDKNVSFFYPLLADRKPSRSIPNDPLFSLEWHLRNTGQTGGTISADADITPVWDDYQGNGVTIGIVDDGLNYFHNDLSPNYNAALSHDFFGDDNDPSPGSSDNHGTAVAGVAAARGNNGIGVSGAAPRATLAGLRLTSGDTTDQMEADALSYLPNSIDIYNNSWGPTDDGKTLEGPGPLTLAALQNGATSGRDGKGNIYVWAAGNGKAANDNVNYDGYANSHYTLAISAIDHNGVQSSYSEPGAPILVAAYSSGGGASITTTDRAGSAGYSSTDYTSSFGGTSAAAPLAAGVIALMLQANPNLTWRDVEQILAHTATRNDASDSGWSTNGAGLHVNSKYGFGAIDANAAVSLASNWTDIGAEQSISSGTLSVAQTIPDNSSNGLTRTFDVSSQLKVETVEVVFNATHLRRGQLRVVLTSPDGTQSILADTHSDTGDHYPNWVFTTKRNWDELSQGTWTLKVTDTVSNNTGTWNSWKLNIYGTTPVQGVYEIVVNGADVVTGFDFGNHDIAAPSIASTVFNFAHGQSITVQFSEEIDSATLSAADLTLEMHGSQSFVDSGSIQLSYDPITHIATFTFGGFASMALSDGNYTASLNTDCVSDASGNPLSDGASIDFFVLGADANRDRKVDAIDLGILASNWQGTSRDFLQGDFNNDQTVDISDLFILAQHWQSELPAPAPPANFLSSVVPVHTPPARRAART